MQKTKNLNTKKTTFFSIALILTLALSTMIVLLPTAGAQTPIKTTYAVIGATPNPVGQNQEVLLWIGITDQVAHPQPGWSNLTVTVTRPDGETETLGPYTTDTTGSTGDIYIPTMIGEYKLQTHFPEQILTVTSAGVPAGTIMQASDSEIITLTVQEEPREYWPEVPHPEHFWTRPIDAQFRQWSTIAGNWLGKFTAWGGAVDLFAPHNKAPETGHILWAEPLTSGGLVGGDLGPHSYDHGDAYEGKWTPPVIINGILYYNRHQSQGGTNVNQEVVAQDLRTGEILWIKNWNNERLLFGQIFYWDSYNMHGAFPYLWTSVGSTWKAYDAFTGRLEFTIENVPSGTTVRGPRGEIMRLQVNLNQGYMALWNSSALVSMEGSWRPQGRTYDASTATPAVQRAWMWNVTIPQGLPGGVARILDDRVVGANARPFAGAKVSEFQTWAISLKPEDRGDLLFNTSWQVPEGNLTISFVTASLEDDVFVMVTKETREHFGFNLSTGENIWGPSESQPYLDAYDIMAAEWNTDAVAYGKLFRAATAGILYTYDIKTGELLWTYNVTDTYTEILWSENWPLKIAFVSDGKIYLTHCEHSPIDPLPRGAPFVAVDVETGEKVFDINLRGHYWGGLPIIGDSIITMFNTYDNRIYAIGKGPSETTVVTPDNAQAQGTPVLIRGSVMDISPGTTDSSLSLRFPKGLAAVSDHSMSDWMEHVYLQYPEPRDVTGVEVTLTIRDPNGEYYVTTATTEGSSGMFSHLWSPVVPGTYFVTAEFKGSNSYYPSKATTFFAISEAEVTPQPTPTPPTPTPTPPPTDEPTPTPPPTEVPPPDAPAPMNWYIIIAAAVIVAVVATTAVILKKRK